MLQQSKCEQLSPWSVSIKSFTAQCAVLPPVQSLLRMLLLPPEKTDVAHPSSQTPEHAHGSRLDTQVAHIGGQLPVPLSTLTHTDTTCARIIRPRVFQAESDAARNKAKWSWEGTCLQASSLGSKGDGPASSRSRETWKILGTQLSPWHTPRVRPCRGPQCCRTHLCNNPSAGECSSTAHMHKNVCSHTSVVSSLLGPGWH